MFTRVKTGIVELDDMLDGGLYKGSICELRGAPGTGKSSIGLEFIANGIEKFDEPGLIVTFEEFPEQIYRDATSIGFDLRKYERQSKLKVIFTTPAVFRSELEKSDGTIDRLIAELGAQRAFIDSVTHFERLTSNPLELRRIIYALLNGLKRCELTTLVAQEERKVTGTLFTSDTGLSFIVDTIIQLKYVEIDSTLQKALVILKERASKHDKRIRQLQVTSKGVKIGKAFQAQQGILSGTPRHASMADMAAEDWEL